MLQALTRVNRPYKNFRYGYVVDFADIQSEFDKTNQAYFKELENEFGDETKNYNKLFKSQIEIEKEIDQIKNFLFRFDTDNLEIFSQQISSIDDKKKISEVNRVLNSARELFNLIRLSGNYDLLNKIDIQKISKMYRITSDRISLLNTKESLENADSSNNLLNLALEDTIFAFIKISEEEMLIADEYKNKLQRTRESLGDNFDQQDPIFISLKEELKRLFEKKKLNEISKDDMNKNIIELDKIYKKSKELERNNQMLKAKYNNDEKYVRIHKRLIDKNILSENENKLFQALNSLKKETDENVYNNSNILENENFVKKMFSRIIIEQLKDNHNLPLNLELTKNINTLIVNEYLNEYRGLN